MTFARDLASLGDNAATLEKQGLTLINTTSFSAVASQSIDSVFTSTYENYVIVFDAIGSTNAYWNWNLRAAGADTGGSNYQQQRTRFQATSLNTARDSNTTYIGLSAVDHLEVHSTITIYRPQIANKTFGYSETTSIEQSSYTSPYTMITSGLLNASTQCDGWKIAPNTGTMTGTIRIYGIAN
jgi:hypothetical protein